MSKKQWIAGNINHDGVVDLMDLAMIGSNWLKREPDLPTPED